MSNTTTNSQQQRYIHQKKLGTGAMGEVWLAEDTLLNRPVAVKYLKAPEQAINQEFFLSEARTLARLQHPNITLIYDAVFDADQQKFYLVMEYVEGESLDRLIKQSSVPLPFEIILDIAVDVLQALQYAHEQDVVHRDIKPANILIHKKRVKLTDFGLSSLMSAMKGQTNITAGTPEYMSPEQIQGVPLDGRADLYSLGVTLFEMLTGGHLPFENYKNVHEIFLAHVNDEPPLPREFIDGVPVVLEHAIMQLLAKEPDARYPSTTAALKVFKSLQARQKATQSYLNLLDPEAMPLIDRDDELRQLATVWDQVQESVTPRLAVLKGSTGIGKTRLALEFIGRTIVDRGFVAVAGRSDEFDIPYDPFAEIFVTILNRKLTRSAIPQDQLNRLLIQIPDLARLLHYSLPTAQSQTHNVEQAHWQFFAAALSILTELGPAVIFIEDATTLDEASLELLRFLIHREQLPLMFVATCRDNGQTGDWFDSFAVDEKTVINLAPLSSALVKTYLTQWIGGPAPNQVVNLIQKQSRGCPLQIEELAQQMIETGALKQNRAGQWYYIPPKTQRPPSDISLSQSINTVLTKRLEQLPPDSRQGLILAALLKDGYEFDFDTWLTLLGGKSQSGWAKRILDEAIKKRVVRQIDENRYAFRPVEMGKALVSGLPDEERRSLHFEIADILEESQASPILIGHHYEQAGLIKEAARFLESAGDKAAAGHAIDVAISYYSRAVKLVESRSVYKALGKLYQQTGRGKAAIDNYQRALVLAEQAGDTTGQANILNSISFTLCHLRDQYKEAYQRAATVLKLPGAPKTEQAVAQSHLGMISWLMGRLQEAEEWCLKAVEALKKQDNKAGLAGAFNRLGLVYFSMGKLSGAETAFQASLELRRELDDTWGQAYCLNNLGKVALDRGNFEEASSFFESAQNLFEKIDGQDGLMVIYTNRGRTMLYQNDPEKALPWLTKALHLARQIGKSGTFGLSEIYLLLAQVNLQLGAIERAEAAANDALKIVKTAGNQEYIAAAQATLAQIYAVQGNQTAAETAYQRAMDLFKQIGSVPGTLRTQLNYAQFLTQQGDTDTALNLKKKTRAEAQKTGLYLPPNLPFGRE